MGQTESITTASEWKSVKFPEYEEYETHHANFVQQILQDGITLPEWNSEKKGWYDIDSPGNPTQSWESGCLSALGNGNECYVAALESCKKKIARMQETEEGMDRYFEEMQSATFINIQLKDRVFGVFQASQSGAKMFANNSSQSLRVCLENKDGLDLAAQQCFEQNIHVPLDDGSPFSRAPSMSKSEYAQFTDALLEAMNWKIESKGGSVLVHCSQGQSRSGLFVVCLFFILCKKSNPDKSNDKLLGEVISSVSKDRNILDFSPRWYSFLPFFCSNISFSN